MRDILEICAVLNELCARSHVIWDSVSECVVEIQNPADADFADDGLGARRVRRDCIP